MSNSHYATIYAIVRQIPYGKVSTYGDIAKRAGLPRHARLVGYALHALPADTDIPWHRVVNAQGFISLQRLDEAFGLDQRYRLLQEGIIFNNNGGINLIFYKWS
jgi:methylated-DNA-protein-cysteine methyltransferase-like protein